MNATPRPPSAPVRGGLVLLALALVIWGVWPRSSGRGPSDSPQNERLGAGFAVLLGVADELGLGCAPWGRSLGALPEKSTLLLLAPTTGLAEHELEPLLGWVRRGGNLIYVPPEFADEDLLLAELGLRLVTADDEAPDEDSELVAVRATRRARTAEDWELSTELGQTLVEGLPRTLRVGNRWLASDEFGAEVLLSGFESQEHAAHVFYDRLQTDPNPGLLAWLDFPAAGRVHVLSDSRTLRNRGIHDRGLGLPLLRALALSPKPRFVDRRARETGSGFSNPVGDLARAGDHAFGRLVLLILVGLGLIAWLRALPLGSPREEPEPVGLSSLEHVRALASAWQLSGDEDGAARRVAEALSLQTGSVSITALRSRLALWKRRHPALAAELNILTDALDGLPSASLDDVTRAATRVRHLGTPATSRPIPPGDAP